VRTATEIGHAQAEAASRVNLGQLYALQGRYQQAREHYDQALQLARRGQDAHCEAMVLGNIGLVCLAQNRVEEAGDWLNQAHSLARKTGDHDSLMNAERGLAELELSRNNPASARTLLEAAIHASEGRAHGDTIIPFRRLLARSCRLLGDIEIAKRLALDTLRLARSAGYRTEEMWSLLELALQNPPERRENSPEFREAIDIARSLEIESLLRSAARQ
jgi:tetratricopeptide (TPR) repeat protein